MLLLTSFRASHSFCASCKMPRSLRSAHKGRYTLGDKLQQRVAAKDHSMCTGPATSCSNKLRRHVAATNRFVCAGEVWWKSLSLQQSFVAATSRTNSVWFDFLRLVVVTKLCCGDKDFHKNCPAHTKRFVAATCRCNVLLQLVAKCVPTLKGLLCRLMYCSSNTKKYASKPLLGNRLF